MMYLFYIKGLHFEVKPLKMRTTKLSEMHGKIHRNEWFLHVFEA